MKKNNLLLMLFISLFLFLFSSCSSNTDVNNLNIDDKYSLNIGWQTTWATQGQLAMIMQNTNILDTEGIDANFIGFSYGGTLNQAALAGEVDVVLTADQPALTLLANSDDWEIIGRLMYNSGALMVHPESEFNSITDLNGSKIAVPYVAAVHRILIGMEKDNGLVPQKDIENINLGLNEIIAVAQSGNGSSHWGDFGAMMVWDPTPYILEEKGLSRTIARGDIVAVILMKKDKTSNPEIPKKFLNGFRKSYYFYSQNQNLANDWFADVARIDYDSSILDKAADFEPNVKSNSFDEIRVMLNSQDLITLNEVNNFMYEQELIKNKLDLNSVINLNYLFESEKELTNFDLNEVKIK